MEIQYARRIDILGIQLKVVYVHIWHDWIFIFDFYTENCYLLSVLTIFTAILMNENINILLQITCIYIITLKKTNNNKYIFTILMTFFHCYCIYCSLKLLHICGGQNCYASLCAEVLNSWPMGWGFLGTFLILGIPLPSHWFILSSTQRYFPGSRAFDKVSLNAARKPQIWY